MDRQSLRQKVYRLHARYDTEQRNNVATCPLSGTALVDAWDLHEVFVRRSSVPPKHQDLIMVLENCIPLEHEAHIRIGNSKEALRKCALRMFDRLSATRIKDWYIDLWQEHDLSVDRGLLLPPKEWKVRNLVPLIDLGAAIHNRDMPETGWEVRGDKGTYDIRAQVALRYQGKRRRWKERISEHRNGVDTRELYTWLDEGYAAKYMFGVLGLNGHVDSGHVVWYNATT